MFALLTTHIHTHTHTHTHTRARARTHARTQARTNPNTHTHNCTRPFTHNHTITATQRQLHKTSTPNHDRYRSHDNISSLHRKHICLREGTIGMKIEKTPDHNFTGLENKMAEGRIHCSPHLIKYSAPKKGLLAPLPPPNVSKANRC